MFPASPQQLTTAWLTQVLGHPVLDFAVEPFGAGTGIIGLVTRVRLSAPSGPASVIAKFPSPVPENRAVAQTYDMYGREIDFYRTVAPLISLRVPRCYHSEINPGTGDFVLLLEDLGGLRVGDQVSGCSLADAHLVVEALARLHASTWQGGAAGSPVHTLIRHDNPAQRDGMVAGFRMGWPVVESRFGDLIPPGREALGEVFPNAVPRLLAQMCREPMCVVHADVRLDNVMFDEGDIALVDWQSVCLSAPEQDLAYFVTQSLPDDVRRAEDWVSIYHAALQRQGIDYALMTCRERFRISALYLLCYAVIIAGTLDMGSERGVRLARTLLGNALRSLTEVDAFSLLERDAS